MNLRMAHRASKVARVIANADGDLSFTKVLVVFFCTAGWYDIHYTTIFMGMAYAVAFGKSTFEALISRMNWNGSESTVNTTNTSSSTILDRRTIDKDIGYESTP